MWLRLIGAWMAASWLLEQVVLHRDWGRHVPTLSNFHVTFEGKKYSSNLGDLEYLCAG